MKRRRSSTLWHRRRRKRSPPSRASTATRGCSRAGTAWCCSLEHAAPAADGGHRHQRDPRVYRIGRGVTVWCASGALARVLRAGGVGRDPRTVSLGPREPSRPRCDRQIRNRGTLGGALVSRRSGRRDAAGAVTLGARLRIVGHSGRRELHAEAFFQDLNMTALEPTSRRWRRWSSAMWCGHRGGRRGARPASRRLRRGQRGPPPACARLTAAGAEIRIGLGAVADRVLDARFASQELAAGTRLQGARCRGGGGALPLGGRAGLGRVSSLPSTCCIYLDSRGARPPGAGRAATR